MIEHPDIVIISERGGPCLVCKKPTDPRVLRKFCSRKCSQISQRGRKLPHSKEWEANRVAALQVSGAKRRGIKIGPRPPGVIEKMHAGREEWKKANPDKARALSIANLPKIVSGERNGNWRGGKTQQARSFHIRNVVKLKKWRDSVLARDGHRCKECGATKNLDAHHIVPLMKTTSFAFNRMNGVCLCRRCHAKTESYGGRGKKKGAIQITPLAWIQTIPHHWQDYNTVGNYCTTDEGCTLVLVSDMGNADYEFLVAIHEFIEAKLCHLRGISDEAVTAFDVAFEEARKPGDLSEPGDDPRAPYGAEHCVATAAERLLCAALGVKWADYERAVQGLSP